MRSQHVLLEENRAALDTFLNIANCDPYSLTRSERIEILASIKRIQSWLTAFNARVIVTLAGLSADESHSPYSFEYEVDESAREEISAQLHMSNNTAQREIDFSRAITVENPEISRALALGEISRLHARITLEQVAPLQKAGVDSTIITAIVNRALGYAELHTPAELTRFLKKLTLDHLPEQALTSDQTDRFLRIWPEGHGMLGIAGRIDAVTGTKALAALDSIIESSRNSATPLVGERDVARADALRQLVNWQDLAKVRATIIENKSKPTIKVLIDLPTLLGLADHPGELHGYGAIPANLAREFAADGRWQAFVTDANNDSLLWIGRTHYQPSPWLQNFIRERDQRCRFPGCSTPARFTDIDHVQPFDQQGETTPPNLQLLCRRHHRLKTHHRWSSDRLSCGTTRWTAPSGHQYEVAPVTLGAPRAAPSDKFTRM